MFQAWLPDSERIYIGGKKNMAQWIWKFGEFEIYHNMLVHTRRQQYGHPEPVVWKLYMPEPVVCFKKQVTTQGGIFYVHACGDPSVTVVKADGTEVKYGGKTQIPLEPGTALVTIRVGNIKTFPALYVDGVIETDGTWLADDMTQDWQAAGTWDVFDGPEKTPEIFTFAYERLAEGQREQAEGGVLFDYGRETFARIKITGLSQEKVAVRFGESREEAMDPAWCVIRFEDAPEDGCLAYEPYAFRYIFVSDPNARIQAEYEFLPLERKGSFKSGDPVIDQVWETAAYTFHLNCREFFLDGIKRDRWVWSADAYQSLFVNRYLFLDPEIEKRTLIALGGKRPFKAHINTIMDYTFFWIISLYEYYKTYGDKKFLEQMAPQMKEIMDFCLERTDEDGLIRGREGDWIFIDWAPMDKTGALCPEQILYAKAMECYAAICRVIGISDRQLGEKAKKLQDLVFEKFYDPQLKVFIDSYESGNKNVTRQTNILAYLFLPCTKEQKADIYERVILNPGVRQITTPYFKFYENQVHCQAGQSGILEDSIRSYYGSMLDAGATTLYEEYDPAMEGVQHYAMYGHPFEKSLCHAWSASPIYLLGCYRLGVQNTGIAYDTFDVRPDLGNLTSFSGTVPVPGGEVRVWANAHEIRVWTNVSGGTLYAGGQAYPLSPGETAAVSR